MVASDITFFERPEFDPTGWKDSLYENWPSSRSCLMRIHEWRSLGTGLQLYSRAAAVIYRKSELTGISHVFTHDCLRFVLWALNICFVSFHYAEGVSSLSPCLTLLHSVDLLPVSKRTAGFNGTCPVSSVLEFTGRGTGMDSHSILWGILLQSIILCAGRFFDLLSHRKIPTWELSLIKKGAIVEWKPATGLWCWKWKALQP